MPWDTASTRRYTQYDAAVDWAGRKPNSTPECPELAVRPPDRLRPYRLATGDAAAGLPARRAAAARWTRRSEPNATADDEPRDERVRVPHLACSQFIAAPDRCRHFWHELQEPLGKERVDRQPSWALDRLVDIRDHPVTPAPDLVAEDAQRPSPAAADRAFGDDAAQNPVFVGDRCHFDRRTSRPALHHQGRVVEIAGRPLSEPGCHSLEDTSVHPDRAAPGTERKPVEIDGSPRLAGNDVFLDFGDSIGTSPISAAGSTR